MHVPQLPLTADPLIEEANRRKRRRRLALAAAPTVAALVVALALALRPGGPGNPRSGGPAPSGAPNTTQAAAGRTADGLLRQIPLPRGAERVSVRTASALAATPNYGTDPSTQYEYRHAFWRVPEPLASVVAFLRQHPPPDFAFRVAGWMDPYPQGLLFTGASVGGRVPSRILAYVAASHGATIVRVDAGVPWTVPRSPSEALPGTVREIDLKLVSPGSPPAGPRGPTSITPRPPHRVTDPREVSQIVGWFNALNVLQPNTMVHCATGANAWVQFTFRSAHGAALATAGVPFRPADSCEEIGFTLHGRRQTPLVDSTPYDGMNFLYRVERLTGLWLGPRSHF